MTYPADTPYHLSEGRSLHFYLGARGDLETFNRWQEKKERWDIVDRIIGDVGYYDDEEG